MFHCKQFSVAQDNCAMKVNTDSMILGSWANVQTASSILDVGTGSGILALMMAQKSQNSPTKAFIDAIEIDDNAAKQASLNFANTKWSSRLRLIHCDVTQFNASQPYDVIIANPPYFDANTKNTNAYRLQTSARTVARQTTNLSPSDFFRFCTKNLANEGVIYCVYPYSSLTEVMNCAATHKLYLSRVLHVKHNSQSQPYLCAMRFSRHKIREVLPEHLVIRTQDNAYTTEFKNLCKPFYLKF